MFWYLYEIFNKKPDKFESGYEALTFGVGGNSSAKTLAVAAGIAAARVPNASLQKGLQLHDRMATLEKRSLQNGALLN